MPKSTFAVMQRKGYAQGFLISSFYNDTIFLLNTDRAYVIAQANVNTTSLDYRINSDEMINIHSCEKSKLKLPR